MDDTTGTPPKTNNSGPSRPHRDFVHGWILKIAAAANVELSEATQAVYLEELCRLDRDALAVAGHRTIREWDRPNMMPPIAFITARTPVNPQVKAEAAWETLQKIIYRDWHPDVGWSRPVQLEPAMEYAVRQCGGLLRIHDCPQDTFNFLRKDFLAAFARYEAEGGEQVKLSHVQAKELLGKLQKELPQ